MQESIQLAGLILAAGNSTRMGADKAMLPWPPSQAGAADAPRQTLLSAALSAFAPFTRMTVVVAGKNAESVAGAVAAHGAHLARNPAPENGQFSSLQIGLHAAVHGGCNAAMITPVDCPPLSPAALEHLYYGFLAALSADIWAVIPEHEGRHGHPLLAGPGLVEQFLAAPITGNAREILHRHASRVLYLAVREPLVKSGLNTPEEYEASVRRTAPEP